MPASRPYRTDPRTARRPQLSGPEIDNQSPQRAHRAPYRNPSRPTQQGFGGVLLWMTVGTVQLPDHGAIETPKGWLGLGEQGAMSMPNASPHLVGHQPFR